jgi:hypothetical protein
MGCIARLLLANEDAALVGCVADGADGLVGIKAGGITGDELLIACEGLHVVGFAQGDGPAWSRPPRGSRVYRPQGRVEARLGATYATLAQLPDGIALPARQVVRLTSAMVGVNGSGIGDARPAEPTAPGTPMTPATILATLEKALADTADLADWIKAIRAAQAEQRRVAEKTALKGASKLRRAAASAAERLRADDAS